MGKSIVSISIFLILIGLGFFFLWETKKETFGLGFIWKNLIN